jgi:peptide deformylase
MTNKASDRTTDEYALTTADIARFHAERKRGMVAVNDPVLNKIAQEVPLKSVQAPHIIDIIARLHAVAHDQRNRNGEETKRRTLVGLAAPQIGESCRIILVDTTVDESRKKYGELKCFINPVILWRSREMVEGREGCFSAGPVWGLVRRPIAIKIAACGVDGKQFTTILEGMGARIACHEIDHLEGIRFPDRIRSDRKRHWVHTDELPGYAKQIIHWKRVCTRERWEKIKSSGLAGA